MNLFSFKEKMVKVGMGWYKFFAVDNGDTRKIPKFNVKLYIEENNEDE